MKSSNWKYWQLVTCCLKCCPGQTKPDSPWQGMFVCACMCFVVVFPGLFIAEHLFFFYTFFKYLFYFILFLFLAVWVFVSVRGLSLVAASGRHSSSQCAGLSLLRPLLLRSAGSRRAGSVVVAHGPSCSAACGIFPDQGSNPCPPALAGGFLTTVPPGKSLFILFELHLG